ncbi:transcriptional regulator [Caldichromatium japonicum]|uniref:Transcriptional regulator n=1 Tax=Caldichromatium japonicum TaxID=2699430 RepID=A0A6G7VAL3_9GAMM|nr:MucB/RseB C-terminal domain-containing protein [Caldichromatium japonicum]QIK37109.1 transcriptional regulator [Caldichromatium japonicum]
MSRSSVIPSAAERWARRGLALLCLLAAWGVGAEGPTEPSAPPEILLARMNQALRSLDYDGIVVYLHQNHLETLSLDHRIRDGQIAERLIALSGPIRAVARGADRLNCVLPDGRPISVERTGGTGVLDTEGIDPESLRAYYQIEYLGVSRIAGRETEVVGILPKDDLRYGYRFYIDRTTALPLKSDLIDRQQEPLEQLMFTTINIHPALQLPAIPPQPTPSIRRAPATATSSAWRFDPQPAGFTLVMERRITQPEGTVAEHFLFTDRLSSYSVYIELASADALEGPASIGSVHAAGRRLGDYQIIAVGEVPQMTVEASVAAVHRIASQGDRP